MLLFKENQEGRRFARKMTNERLKIIDALPIPNGEKADLILVYAGVKPSTCIVLNFVNELDEKENIYKFANQVIPYFATQLSMLGTPYKISDISIFHDPQRPNSEIRKVYVSKNQAEMDKMLQASSDKNLSECYGYPESAYEAYAGKRERLDESKITQEFKAAEAFGYFIKSEDNWRQELEVGKKWADVVRTLNPKLYDRVANPEKYNIIVTKTRPPTEEELKIYFPDEK